MPGVDQVASTGTLVWGVLVGAYVVVRGPEWARWWVLTIVGAVAAVAVVALVLIAVG